MSLWSSSFKTYQMCNIWLLVSYRTTIKHIKQGTSKRISQTGSDVKYTASDQVPEARARWVRKVCALHICLNTINILIKCWKSCNLLSFQVDSCQCRPNNLANMLMTQSGITIASGQCSTSLTGLEYIHCEEYQPSRSSSGTWYRNWHEEYSHLSKSHGGQPTWARIL